MGSSTTPATATTTSASKVPVNTKFTPAPKKGPAQATTGAVPKAPPSSTPQPGSLEVDPLRAMALAQLAAAEGEDDVEKDSEAPQAKRQKTDGEVPTAT